MHVQHRKIAVCGRAHPKPPQLSDATGDVAERMDGRVLANLACNVVIKGLA